MNRPPTTDPSTLLDQISDACYALDAEWRFTLVNRRAEALLGRSREELLGRNCWECFPEAAELGFGKHYERARATGRMVSFDQYYPLHERWYAVRAHPVTDGVLVYFHDDTERREQERRLRESEELYRLVIENSSDVITVLDATGTCTFITPNCEQLTGYTSSELIGNRSERAEAMAQAAEFFRATDGMPLEPAPYLHEFVCKDGRRLWLETSLRLLRDDAGRLSAVHCASRDVTSRVEEERRFRALVDNALDGITLIDAEFEPIYRSPANEVILGHPHRAGEYGPLTIHPDDLASVREKAAALAPYEATVIEYRVLHADGDWRWLRSTFTNRLSDPAIRAIIINFVDITEKRRARDESLRKQAELAETNRQLEVRVARLDALHRVHLAAANHQDLAGTVRAVLASAFEGTPAAACVFLEESNQLDCVVHHGQSDEEAAAIEPVVRPVAARALEDDDILTFDTAAPTSSDLELARLAAAGFRGVHAVPFARSGVRGVVVILAPAIMATDPESLSFVATMTGYLANVVGTMKLLERLERSAGDYKSLARFGQRIEMVNDVEELITEGLRELLAQMHVDHAALAEVDGDWAVPRWRAGEADAGEAELLMRPIPLEQGAVAEAVRTGEPVLISDYRSFDARPEYLEPLRITSVLALPIHARGAGHYVFILVSRDERRQIDETGTSIAALFAQRIGHAFERVAYLDEVKATREATFRSLGLALEYRDYETRGHTDRAVELATRFGQALGFTADQLQALQWGAYLHDLGKLSVPDQILLKPDRLTDDEFELIKRHPVTGLEMCRDIPFLPAATLSVVRHHHERWDGSGYPDRLAGECIPLEARMFALVDVYDALTSDRPYRPAWSEERTLAYLRGEAGKQFDPRLLGTFLELMAEVVSEPA